MKKYAVLFFFAGTLMMMFVMAKTGAPLKTVCTPLGILDLEFAYNAERSAAVIDTWSLVTTADAINAAKINTAWDFLFIFFYSFFLFFACKKIAENIAGPVAKAGYMIAKVALFAAVFDVLENTGMLLTLNGHVSGTISFFTTFFSVIKWVLAIIAVFYVITGGLVLAYRKIRS